MNETENICSNANDLNVDFENYSVSKERGESLRSTIQQVKDAQMVETLMSLVQELGVEEVSSADDQVAGLIKAKNPKVFRYVLEEVSENEKKLLEVYLFEQELRATVGGRSILEVSFLPKDKDFILFYVDNDFLTSWNDFYLLIKEIHSEAQKIKSDRQKHFKKFSKKEAPTHESTSSNS